MKPLMFVAAITAACSCNSGGNKIDSNLQALHAKVEGYSKARAVKPETYKSIRISEKKPVTDTNLVKECYYNKYAPKVVDFGEKTDFNTPAFKDINEKFFMISNDFEAENALRVKKTNVIIIYLDSSDTILSSYSL